MDSLASPFTESKDPEVPGVRACPLEAFPPRTRPDEVRAENSLPVPCRAPASARSLGSARDDRVEEEAATNGMRGKSHGFALRVSEARLRSDAGVRLREPPLATGE